MKQKIFILSLLTLLGSITANAEKFTVGGIAYEIVSNSAWVAKIDGGYSGEVRIPSTISYNNVTYDVKQIGQGAFYDCNNLTSVIIPNSVTVIGSLAFYRCTGLTSVTIPNSVTSIYSSAFSGCSGLTSITIGNSVTGIDRYAFSGCSGLTSITIPNSVTSIQEGAFSGCNSLTSITIPNSVTYIEEGLFGKITASGCEALTSITVADGNSVYESPDGCNAIIKTSTHELVAGCKKTTIPNTVTSIGAYAFCNNKSLTSITIPNSVTSIGSYAFYGCSGLTSVTIPNSVTNIGGCAFSYSGLTSVTIGNSVTSFGYEAFRGCNNLTSIVSEIEEPFVFDINTIKGISSTCTLTVPYGKRDAYIAAGWTESIFRGGVVEAPMTVLTQYDLTDATVYENNVRQDYETLTYTRTFNNTNWQALYVPFSMSYDDWKDDFDVGRIVAYYPFYDEDGTLLRADLILAYVKSGSLIPNHPYFIKSKSTGTKTITLTNATLYPSEENSIDCSTVETRCTFTGTYTSVQREGLLVMGGGTLGSLGNATLSPMRWYMVIKGRNNQIVLPPSNIKIRAVDDFEATAILQQLSERRANTVYDLYGRKLEEMPNRKGVYIINGKKVFIR